MKLSSLIKCERRYAVGLLHDLFTWGLDAAKKDGSLPGLNAYEIASALDFSGKKGVAIVAALVESGYLEKDENGYKIHDWYDYAGKFVEQREIDKDRKQREREEKKRAEEAKKASAAGKESQKKSSGNPPDIQRTASGNPPVTVPNHTVPFKTGDNTYTRAREEKPAPDEDDGFEAFWKAYPRKTGDTREAYMEYRNAILRGVTPETLLDGAKALAERNTAPEDYRHIQSATKWLRNKGWLEKPPDAGIKTSNPFLRMMIREGATFDEPGSD